MKDEKVLQLLRVIVPDPIRRRYTLKFVLAIVAVAVLVGATGAVATMEFAADTRETAGENYGATAQQEASSIGDWLANQQANTEVLARSGVANAETVDNRRLGQFSGTFSRDNIEALESIHVVDEDGTIVGTTSPGMQGQQLTASETPWVDRLESGGSVAVQRSDVYEQEGKQMIAFLKPTTDRDGRWVVLTYNIGTYADSFSGEFMPGDSFTVVVDGNDEIVAHSDESVIGEQYTNGELLSEARSLSGRNNFDYADEIPAIDGLTQERTVAGYAVVDGTDWVVLVHGPTEDAYGDAAAVQRWGLVATLVGVLLIGGVGGGIGLGTARSINRLRGKAAEMENENLNVDLSTGRIDEIGELYRGFGSMRDALRDQIDEAKQARENAEAERQRVQRINDELEAAAAEYCTVMGAAADGDLTVRAAVDTDNESMRTIGEDFNAMLDDIEATIHDLKRFAREVATASEEVTASSEEVKSASEQVSESIQEISDGAERQNDALQSVTGEMESLSTTTEEIAASSNQVADTAERTAETGREGREAAETAIAGMEEVETEIGDAVDEIGRLRSEVAEIDDLVDSIQEIAEQTNMLALNANIEASRSGGNDDGEGFDVVAAEIKDLSADAKEAAEEVEHRLEQIREQTDRSAEEVKQTSDRIADHAETVRQTASALDRIADFAEETNTGIQEISAATEQQAAATEEVVAMVDEAATISEETTSEAETVAGAAEEQTTAMTEVSASAGDLADQAAQLQEALDRFDTADSADGSSPDGGDTTIDDTDDAAFEWNENVE